MTRFQPRRRQHSIDFLKGVAIGGAMVFLVWVVLG
jgi:hypothetical protein